VAKFLGTANIINGSVITHDGTLVFRSDMGHDIPLNQGLSSGRSIVFRPQNIDITAHGGLGDSTCAKLSGAIEHTEFLGSIIRYGVDVNGDMVLVDHAHKMGEKVFDIGEQVDLFIDRDNILVLAA
jgi:iron(III) transport system ATP-binding protein